MSRLAPLLFLTFCAIGALSQLSADELPIPGAEIDVQVYSLGSTRLDTSTAQVSSTTTSVDLSIPLAGSAWFGLELDIFGERQWYRFNDFFLFISDLASPLSEARDLELQPSLVLNPKGPWSVVISPKLQYSSAEHASLNESQLWSLSTAVFYQSRGKFKLGVGLNATQRLNGSALILPFPVIDWQLNEQWNLIALDGESGRLVYRAHSHLHFYGEVRFESRDIRLARKSSIPGGVLRTEDFPVLIGTEYQVSRHTVLRAAVGQTLAQTYRFEDHNGHVLGRSQIHSPFLATVQADLIF